MLFVSFHLDQIFSLQVPLWPSSCVHSRRSRLGYQQLRCKPIYLLLVSFHSDQTLSGHLVGFHSTRHYFDDFSFGPDIIIATDTLGRQRRGEAPGAGARDVSAVELAPVPRRGELARIAALDEAEQDFWGFS